MKIAILTCGMLPIPAVQGGAVENLIDFYLEYNDQKKLHDITVYSPWCARVDKHPALSSQVNHYVYIDVTSLKARLGRKVYGALRANSQDYYNYFIEYYFEKVFAHLKKGDYDFILLENCPGYVCKLSRRGYKNLILHLHNDLLNADSQYHEMVFNGLTKILTVSDFVKERVCTILPTEALSAEPIRPNSKIQTVYNGIDLTRFSPKGHSPISRKDVRFAETDFVMVYSGRINKDKGIAELIEAMLQLADHPRIKLMVLGSSFFDDAKDEDPFIHSLKEKAKPIAGEIAFTGFIPYNQVPDYLQLADIAVLPSVWDEPFGLTIVEAMAVGLPLITTRSGGIPEICEGVATIVNRDNIVEDLVSAIMDLYHQPTKREQMAKASLERAKHFSKNTYTKNIFAKLEEL